MTSKRMRVLTCSDRTGVDKIEVHLVDDLQGRVELAVRLLRQQVLNATAESGAVEVTARTSAAFSRGRMVVWTPHLFVAGRHAAGRGRL